MTDDVRPHVVQALWEATNGAYSEETTAEIIFNATDAEREVVAAMHGDLAGIDLAKAGTLQRALELLRPYWKWPNGTLGAVLKTAPPDVAERALWYLREIGGWTNEEIGVD